MLNKLLLIALVISIFSIGYAADVTVRRDRTYLRIGAGSYHPVITEIPVNTKLELLEREGSWLRVKFDNKTGYIAESSTQEQKPRNDVFAGMSKTAPTSTSVSKHSISAGVKGFGERFSSKFRGDNAFLDYALEGQQSYFTFNEFFNRTYGGNKASEYRKFWKLPARTEPDIYSEAQEGFGLAVAASIANNGIYKKRELEEYVSYVGQIVVEASDVPDIFFRFFILDIPQANAYACPGGFVFITRGMLKALQSEAELAFVLAHEIAHISKFHGIKEAQKRKHHISAESAFDELDAETPAAFSSNARQIETELEEDIFRMFEYLIEGRLDQYEREADYFAILFMARSGYNPQASAALLNRLSQSASASNNQHYRPESIKERQVWVARFSSEYSSRRLQYFDHRDRFNTFKRYF